MNKHGSIGNTNAAKEVTKSSVLTVRCYPHEKAAGLTLLKARSWLNG